MPLEDPATTRHRASRRPARLALLAVAVLLAIAAPASADPWYEHYATAEKALENRDWALAIQELNEALAKRGDSGARVRTYGMKVTSYFPYLKLGIAYYHLGQLDAALQAFETEDRLGALAGSQSGSDELERYRALVEEARQTAADTERERIRQIVQQSLDVAMALETRGQWDEAMAALDQALAVAPDDSRALDSMSRLRQRKREQELDQTIAKLVEEGGVLLRQDQYSEASTLFRRALSIKQDPEAQRLLDQAQAELLAQVRSSREGEDRRALVTGGLTEVAGLESVGRIGEALDRLQSVLALDPSNREALALQDRLERARTEADQQAAIDGLLAEAESRFQAGSAEESLSAANRVLAIEPGNDEALRFVARAYATISRRLLGTGARQNIPPAVRFVDARQEEPSGALVETIHSPDFRLSGVVIDNSPVEIVFYDSGERHLESTVNSQPLGEYYITEFILDARLAPGLSRFRLVATDSEDATSSSEYSVFYARPFFRAPWFYGLLLASVLLLVGAVAWRRARRRARLRSRRFNPYVAGAPVLDDSMFFGRSDLVDRILQTIHNNSLLLYGERRIGKTSIQHQLRKRLREIEDPIYEFHPVYIDLQGTPEERFFATMAEDIFQELAPVLDGLEPEKDPSREYSYRDFIRDVHAVLKRLKIRSSKKIKLVLLIDEVDELNDYDPRINQKLRSLFMKSFAENLIAVVSGVEIKKQWEKEGSPWYNFFEEIEVKPLGKQEARNLVERPIRGIFSLDDGITDRIVSMTDGKPYLIQKLCISLVTRLHRERRHKITVEDLEAVSRPEGA